MRARSTDVLRDVAYGLVEYVPGPRSLQSTGGAEEAFAPKLIGYGSECGSTNAGIGGEHIRIIRNASHRVVGRCFGLGIHEIPGVKEQDAPGLPSAESEFDEFTGGGNMTAGHKASSNRPSRSEMSSTVLSRCSMTTMAFRSTVFPFPGSDIMLVATCPPRWSPGS